LREYSLERFRNDEPKPEEPSIEIPKTKPVFKKKLKLKTVSELSDTHFAKKYCIDRKIPEESLYNLYYAPDFKKFVEDLGVDKNNLIDDDKRLVIPFYDKNKNLVALQGRTLTNSNMRYITVKITEESEKFFGLDRINEDEKIYVVEGPIDSLFLENAIATADSNLTRVDQLFDKSKFVLVFDNEPRNKEIIKLLDKAIENHYNVVIWPEMIESKDINDMVLEGFTVDDIRDIIEKNTFVNLRAKMEFINWKKV
jgi:DNA primase